MANGRDSRKRGIAVTGSWLPLPLSFLRSRACASLSPHGAKLLLDVLAMLGPNATKNGDLSLSFKAMAARGWPGRSTLGAAVAELEEHGLLARTRQGGRLDCTLWAVTLFPIDCDVRKLDTGATGSFARHDYEKAGADEPTEGKPANWRRARKTQTLAPPRDDVPDLRPATVRSPPAEGPKKPTSYRHVTKPPVFGTSNVPPRGTYLDSHL